jgi:hypothetical protein
MSNNNGNCSQQYYWLWTYISPPLRVDFQHAGVHQAGLCQNSLVSAVQYSQQTVVKTVVFWDVAL